MMSNEHVLYNQNETFNDVPEKKGMSKKLIATISGIALTTMLLSGCGSDTSKATNPNQLAATVTAGETQKQPIPTEAKGFVDQYGSRYADPVATYYAEAAYEKKHNGTKSLIGDEYIESYKMTELSNGERSDIGFTNKRVALDKKMDQAGSIDIFNTYISDNLNLYMNMLAKNPTGRTKEIIDNQFMTYCEGTRTAVVNHSDYQMDSYAEKLLDTLCGIVSEYGSSANYKIAPATMDNAADRSGTLYSHSTPPISLVNSKNKVIGYSDYGIKLVVNIEVFDKKGESYNTTESVDNFQLVVKQRDETDYISFGQN